MTRGTTPSYIISFKEEIMFDSVEIWSVTLKQIPYELNIDNPEVDPVEKTLTVTLTQEQTLGFRKGMAELQVRGVFADGTAFASDIGCVPICPVLDNRVLGGSE